MSKLYFVDLGYHDPTVVYELKPVKIAELKNATLIEVASKLEHNGVQNVLVDAGHPREIEMLAQRLRQVKGIRWSVKQDDSSPKPQSEAPSVDEILNKFGSKYYNAHEFGGDIDALISDAKAKIYRLIVQARFDEINKVDDIMENEAKQPDEYSTAMYVSQRLYELEQLSNNLNRGDV